MNKAMMTFTGGFVARLVVEGVGYGEDGVKLLKRLKSSLQRRTRSSRSYEIDVRKFEQKINQLSP